MSSAEHKKHTPIHLKFAIITVSTSRYEKNTRALNPGDTGDGSGKLMIELVEEAGHAVWSYLLVPDQVNKITDAVEKVQKQVDVIIISGGTGISPMDVTIEAVSPLFIREIPGFGEFFRELSREDIGTAAMLSRAAAGIINKDVIVFCLPGSPDGVRIALTRLILPEIGHLVKHARMLA